MYISIAIIGLLADRGIHIVVTVTMVVPGSSDKYTILCFALFKALLVFFLLLEFDSLPFLAYIGLCRPHAANTSVLVVIISSSTNSNAHADITDDSILTFLNACIRADLPYTRVDTSLLLAVNPNQLLSVVAHQARAQSIRSNQSTPHFSIHLETLKRL